MDIEVIRMHKKIPFYLNGYNYLVFQFLTVETHHRRWAYVTIVQFNKGAEKWK